LYPKPLKTISFLIIIRNKGQNPRHILLTPLVPHRIKFIIIRGQKGEKKSSTDLGPQTRGFPKWLPGKVGGVSKSPNNGRGTWGAQEEAFNNFGDHQGGINPQTGEYLW